MATIDTPRTHVMQVMDHTGDTKKTWNPDNRDEVDDARQSFNRLKKKGYIAYRVDGDGGKAAIMTEFDPTAASMILAPAMRGG